MDRGQKGVVMATDTSTEAEYEIVFLDGDLPKRKGGGRSSAWYGILEQVMVRPGSWAMIRSFEKSSQAGSAAGHLRHDAVKPGDGSWEFTSRGEDLYAKYSTEPAAASPSGKTAKK